MFKFVLAASVLSFTSPLFAENEAASASEVTQSAPSVGLLDFTKAGAAGDICASTERYCNEVARSIMLLNSADVSVQSHCVGYSLKVCSTTMPYHIRTKIRQLGETK